MNERKLVTFNSTESLPNWVLVHYLQQTETNYIKLFTIYEMIRLLDEGALPGEFALAGDSAPLTSSKPITRNLFNTIIYIDKLNHLYPPVPENSSIIDKDALHSLDKHETDGRPVHIEKSPEQLFWTGLARKTRPVVFRDLDTIQTPLYNPLGDAAFKIRNISVNSPANISIEGVGKIITDLYYAPEREERTRRQSQLEQIGQATRNLEDMARASQTIDDPRTSNRMKSTLNHMLNDLIEKQHRFNADLGTGLPRFDEIV